ncbi:hypothetical protein [Flagellimonas sediminis]|uniref:DUF4398 domain-containing protein n=1 Tax=Flagellimonas sediminis TaxID=2696468 RepID=A0A6I5L149_9FLAO|nr:hypothetical protein [Allomuricauda sediminis]NDV42760.1 hypothetical protein [Allomuricauda sediminis]
MAPKSHVLVVAVMLIAVQTTFAFQCDAFYSKVTYALNHCKKAMTATNFEHQMYYAERAWEALDKAKASKGECDCQKADEKTIDAMESLDKAIEPSDWEAGRFFTKKAQGQISELITFLDECTMGISTTTTVVDTDTTVFENEAHPQEENTKSVNTMEMEMIKIFDKHAQDKLHSAENAINQLVELSKTIGTNPTQDNGEPNNLAAHQKAYLEKAKKLLEEGIKNLGGEE